LGMTERIYKLQPNRTLALRGFDQLGASAALHAATDSSFKVSGIFRDPADFAVLILWDADDFYEHPSIKYLPDFNFAGTTLTFDAAYDAGLQPLDSPKYNWIDWATLDSIRADGTSAQVRMWDFAMLQAGSFGAAAGVFDFETGSGLQPYDRVSLWFLNLAYDFIVSPSISSVEYQFFAHGTGTVHSISVNGRTYTHTESNAAGESSADQATALVAAVNSGSGDPQVSAAIGSVPHAVKLTVNPAAAGHGVPISGSDGNAGTSLSLTTLATVVDNLRDQINATDWVSANTTHSLIAASSPTSLTVKAGRYGKVSTNGTAVTSVSGIPFVGLTSGLAFRIDGTEYTIASVDGPRAITLTASAGTQTNVSYLAERGGVDGNMIEMYSLNKTDTLKCTQGNVRFSGGSSDATWRCSVDFATRGIDQLRQCWLTFAPPLANGAAFVDTEWHAEFTNWALTGPEATRALQVAGPGSTRIEETDSACTYSGNFWLSEQGFFSQSFGKVASTLRVTNPPSKSSIGDSVTVHYSCGFQHDVYIGTSLYKDRATAGIRLDGDAETELNCYLDNEPAVNTRRKVRSRVAEGSHSVVIRLKTPGALYFDFLEAVVPSDIPDPPPARTNIAPALDYSTDHSYKLSPARLMWNFDRLGFEGPMNEYIGIFWWNQRKRTGAVIPSLTVSFDGNWVGNDTIVLSLSGSEIGKTVFPADTTSTIASHFARYINAVFVGLWAQAAANVLTVSVRSPAYSFVVTAIKTSTNGTFAISPASGSLKNGNLGTWVVDPSQSPALNRGAREWHADLYSECRARGREIVTAESMELVNPPDGFAAKFHDGTAVSTDEGFGSLHSTHCAQSPLMLAYQQAVLTNIADLQAAAGLTPSLQCGEFLWWFFPHRDASGVTSMAYYDDATAAAAQAALGRPLQLFSSPNDDPDVNDGADATFLRSRLRDHVAALVAQVRSAHPNARFEVLFPYDVNHPTPVGVHGELGGKLNRFINFPVEWESKLSSGFDVLKMEALAFGGNLRNLDLARTAIRFPIDLGWPLNSIRYLVPVFGPATPWEKEWAIAIGEGIPVTNLWAFDQVSIFGLRVRELGLPGRSVYFGR
ncbi:MAG: hypothetical protein M3Z85_04610, partial [Acidobacteriota bacterium]|nr:hypothetical protein [Acidobacteriota bacterium]